MAERAYDSVGWEIKQTTDQKNLEGLAEEAKRNRGVVTALEKEKNAVHFCANCPLNIRES